MKDKNLMRLALFISAIIIGILFIAFDVKARELPVEVVACESSAESLEGKIAVSSVIKTRMKERGQTAEQVVSAKSQFSCYKSGKVIRKITDSEYKMALKAWNMAKAGEFNHYYAHKLCNPKWAKAWKKKKIIGNHTFLKI